MGNPWFPEDLEEMSDPKFPRFPADVATELAAELTRLASKLEESRNARVRAESTLTEFKGSVADEYREDFRSHVVLMDVLISRFRRTAGNLRRAITEHEEAVRRHRTAKDLPPWPLRR